MIATHDASSIYDASRRYYVQTPAPPPSYHHDIQQHYTVHKSYNDDFDDGEEGNVLVATVKVVHVPASIFVSPMYDYWEQCSAEDDVYTTYLHASLKSDNAHDLESQDDDGQTPWLVMSGQPTTSQL